MKLKKLIDKFNLKSRHPGLVTRSGLKFPKNSPIDWNKYKTFVVSNDQETINLHIQNQSEYGWVFRDIIQMAGGKVQLEFDR